MNAHDTAEVVRAYHDAWTRKDYARANVLLAGTLAVEVPVNDYPTAESFAAAVESFGSIVSNVELLAAMSDGNEAMLLYDLEAGPVGTLRVAEHFYGRRRQDHPHPPDPRHRGSPRRRAGRLRPAGLASAEKGQAS